MTVTNLSMSNNKNVLSLVLVANCLQHILGLCMNICEVQQSWYKNSTSNATLILACACSAVSGNAGRSGSSMMKLSASK